MWSNPLLWLIALPLAASPLVYLSGRLAGKGARRVALGVLAVTWLPLVSIARGFGATGPVAVALGAMALRLDGLSLLVATLGLALGTLVVLYSGPDIAGGRGEEKYYALVLATIGALIGLACATDLFNLWVWFEALAVTSFVLAAFYHERPATLEASVKYLVQSAAGSTLALLGIALVLAQTGTLNLDQIRASASESPALLAAGALLIVGFGVKTALVPLHTWLPDVYTQAPSGIAALLSGVVTKAGLVVLLRALGALAGVTVSWGALLIGIGALNILAGNLLALRQTRVGRLLAYSSLAHLGYIALGLGIGISSGQSGGAQGGLFHMLTHGILSGLAFLAAGALLAALHGAAAGHSELTVADLSGAARRYPLAALALSLAALGLAGLPPLAGFMSKWQIFVAGFATRDLAIAGLVVFAALNSVLSLAYYAPLVNVLYSTQASPAVRDGRAMPLTMRAPLGLLALAVVLLGVWPALAQPLTRAAGAAVLAAFGN